MFNILTKNFLKASENTDIKCDDISEYCDVSENYNSDKSKTDASTENSNVEDTYVIKNNAFKNWLKFLNNSSEKLNDNDEDEDDEDKIYIISLNNIPHFYEKDLSTARKKMFDIANILLKKANTKDDGIGPNDNYIFTNSSDSMQIISPYNFILLKYHHILYELKIEYVLRYSLIHTL